MEKDRPEGRITKGEALIMLKNADLLDLGAAADGIRKARHPEGIVTFVVDRNINYTNVCINKCRFCAFWRDEGAPDAYLLDDETLFAKIEETLQLGGTQILIQGGLHPSLDINYYVVSKSLDGLFFVLAQEEKKIRKDPVAQVTPLLKQVFGR